MSSPPTSNSRGPSPALISPGYKWWVVFMLWFICFFNYADRQAISVVFPKLKEEFGFDEEQLGYIGSAFMWVYAFGAPMAGYIGDRVRRKDLILGGCLFWSFVTVTTAWCGRLWHFLTVRALEGLGETFYFPASMSMVSDYHSPKTRSRAMSFHQSSVYLGTIGGSWLGAWFAEYHGWRWGFYFFGASGMLLALLLYRFLSEPRRGQSEIENPSDACAMPTGEALRAIFRKPTTWLLMATFVGANFVATIFLIWTPSFLIEKFQFRLTTAGLTGSLFIQVASALSVPLGGTLADWLAQRLPGGRMLVQALGLLAGSTFVFLVGATSDVRTLIVAMSIFGFCKGLYDANIFASLYDVVPPSARATAAGLMNFVGWVGGALGPSVFGWLAMHGRFGSKIENMSHTIAYSGAIYVIGASLLLTAALCFARRDLWRGTNG